MAISSLIPTATEVDAFYQCYFTPERTGTREIKSLVLYYRGGTRRNYLKATCPCMWVNTVAWELLGHFLLPVRRTFGFIWLWDHASKNATRWRISKGHEALTARRGNLCWENVCTWSVPSSLFLCRPGREERPLSVKSTGLEARTLTFRNRNVLQFSGPVHEAMNK